MKNACAWKSVVSIFQGFVIDLQFHHAATISFYGYTIHAYFVQRQNAIKQLRCAFHYPDQCQEKYSSDSKWGIFDVKSEFAYKTCAIGCNSPYFKTPNEVI